MAIAQIDTAIPFDCICKWGLTRADWLAERLDGVGASESPILFGEGYAGTSVYKLWTEKTGLLDSEEETAEHLLVGLDMEPSLRRIFTRKAGLETMPAPSLCKSRQVDYMIASLDSIAIDPEHGPCPLELKNVGEYARHDWSDGEIPLKFQVQLQHQIYVTGAKCAYILGLIGGRKPEYRRVERNDRFIEKTLLPAVQDFWLFVKTKVAPPIDGSAATAEAIRRLYPRSEADFKQASEEAEKACHELRKLKDEAKANEVAQEKLANFLKDEIKDSEGLVDRWNKPLVTWKSHSKPRELFDAKRFKIDHPELAAEYTSEAEPNRPLLIKVKS